MSSSQKGALGAVAGSKGGEGFVSPLILPAGHQQLTLTADQQRAFDRLLPIFRGEWPGTRACLLGFAGTGKTFTSGLLLDQAVAAIPGALGKRNHWGGWAELPTVVICGPTHKSARQLEWALAGRGLQGIQAVTLHSALGLRPRRSEDREWFEPDPTARKLIGPSTRLVVVDESSMVGRELVRLLLAALPDAAALVAIGDPAQLQPVGDPGRSPLFDQPIQARLDHVVRHQGPILALATATRALGAGRPRFVAQVDDHSAVIAHAGFGEWQRTAIRACRDAAQEGNIDGARMLAWTNSAVEKFNAELHRILYGPLAGPYVVGQAVVSHDAILGPDGSPLVSSTCEMRLLAVERGEGSVEGDELLQVREALLGKRRTKAGEKSLPWGWWTIRAQLSGEGSTVTFQVLDPERRSEWTKAANAIARTAKEAKAEHGAAVAKPFWDLYWKRKDRFGRISPVWGLTIHKSQGSTFSKVFIHPGLDRNDDQAERNQLTYVGLTRAARELHVVADPPPPPPPGKGKAQATDAAALAGGAA